MNSVVGVVVGTVKDVKDPEGEGRVHVEFPWMEGRNEGYWAPPATLMAGGKRGSWFMPEVGDEVLVAFEHGDVNHPFIIGFLWNGVDKPPSDDINASVRRLKTVSGHILEFDDNSGKERILLKTKGEHKIELVDAPTASIVIETKGGHHVALKDTGGGTIEIKTKGGSEVTLEGAPPKITVQSSGMNSVVISETEGVTVNCLMAKVTAQAMLNVSAPITVFSGVVQIPTLIAQTVVGTAYTPAPGNTFGL